MRAPRATAARTTSRSPGRLVTAVADRQVAEALLQALHEAHLHLVVGRGVEPHAVEQGQVLDVPVVEEAHDLVDVVDRLSGGGADHGLARGGDGLEKGPVEGAAARHLHDVHLVLEEKLDRRLIEGSDHGEQPGVTGGGDQPAEIAGREPGRQEAGDVLDVGPVQVVRMDEGVEIAVLQLHRGLYPKAPGDAAHLGDDAQPMLHVALVVVRDLEDEEKVRKGLGHAVLLRGTSPAEASQD